MIKMSYAGQGVNDKAFQRFDELEKKKIKKKIDENRPNQIFQSFPSEKILSEDQAINFLVKETGLDESTIIRSVNQLIKDRRLVTAYDTKNRLHLRKNPY